MNKSRELLEEFRSVVVGRTGLIDSLLPPIVFLLINALFGFDYAWWSSLTIGLVLTIFRLARGRPLGYALTGLGLSAVAILMARYVDRARGYFLPDILTGALTLGGCLLSVVLRRPLVAWTSHLARGWPLGWYWHPRVRPAYTEVTLAWAVFFALRLVAQLLAYRGASPAALGIINLALGWPMTVLLLAGSYLYGLWRLGKLGGPSVEEFRRGQGPPWAGQRRGF